MSSNLILKDIQSFFDGIFDIKTNPKGYKYADYKNGWLNNINLHKYDADESKSSRTTKELQKMLSSKYGGRIKVEAPVAEGMTLRFDQVNGVKEI
ncbi:MAG: hypothetical protein Q8O74_08365, partial [bacterium]|nr:hypothetical protein [bacterium]